MKQNAIFAVLTAIVLAFGFYSMDIVEIFYDKPYDNSIINVSRSENNAVFISAVNKTIDPMKIIEPYPYNEIPEKNDEARSIATAMIKAMSRYDNRITIEWGIRQQLFDGWKFSKNGYIYLDKWQYISVNQTERLLDCIVDMKDFSIVYIRFYNDDDKTPNSSTMYSGLDKLSGEAEEFYPHLNDLLSKLQVELPVRDESDSFEFNGAAGFHKLFEIEACSPWDHNSMLLKYIERYNDMKDAISCVTNSSTASFWLSPVALQFLIIDHKAFMYYQDITSDTKAMTTQNVLNRFINDESYTWKKPSYSASGGRIYQTIPIGDDELTVIYSVKEDLIEGYYYIVKQLDKVER